MCYFNSFIILKIIELQKNMYVWREQKKTQETGFYDIYKQKNNNIDRINRNKTKDILLWNC